MSRLLAVVAAVVACSPRWPTRHPDVDAGAEPPPPGLYVAPDGDDAAAGTYDAPFATLGRAIDAMRSSSEKRTNVRAGTYPLRGQTIALDARDTGIELLAYPGETPVISGGFPIAGWTLVDPAANIWSAQVPAELDRVGALTIDGEWFDVARTPDRDPADRQARASWLFVEKSLGPPVANPWEPSFNADKSFVYRAGDLPSSLGIENEPDGWVLIWDKLGWSVDILPIQSIDYGSRTLNLINASQFGLDANSRYFVYGVRAALDAPGEYYIDVPHHQVLVIPKSGKDPNHSSVVASAYNGPPLIAIDGADAVHISGFELRDQHNTSRWQVAQGGGVHVLSGNASVIEHNKLHALGVGVAIDGGAGHVVHANEAYDIGNSGITVDGSGNTIAGNVIHDVGLVEQSANGIWAGPGRNVISHNRIENVPHYGIISGNDRADGLVIEYNVLRNTCQGANDAGAIYLKNRGNYNAAAHETIRFNEIFGSGGLAASTDGTLTSPGFSFAVYLDDGQSGTDVYSNLMVGASSGSVFPHNGTDNHIWGNVFVSGVHEQLFVESANNPHGNVYESNIFASSAATPTIYVKYEGQEATLRKNLFYGFFDPMFFTYSDGSTLGFAAAQSAGYHEGSVVADPRFVDPAHGDYHLQPDSPAFGLGFVELPYEQIGP